MEIIRRIDSKQLQYEKLKRALSNMFDIEITHADYAMQQLHGGTLGDVQLISGIAQTIDDEQIPYNIVLKAQKKWERYGDSGSWHREYDLYTSRFYTLFDESLRWPDYYYAEMSSDKWLIFMEYIEGVTGSDLTVDMFESAAEELGRLQGRLYIKNSPILQDLTNLSHKDAMKEYYYHYRNWAEIYNYVRSADCEIPKHLRDMIVDYDSKAESIWESIEKLPVVLCHRDFWITNIFYLDGKIRLIDWDTTGWGYLGEDIVSLIADEADTKYMLEYYKRCVPAYLKGFSEYVDVSYINDLYIKERIILHFGYRLVEWYKYAETTESKQLQIETLEKIYEISRWN